MKGRKFLAEIKAQGLVPHPTAEGVLVSQKFLDEVVAAAVEGTTDAVGMVLAAGHPKPTYPADHVAGMKVSKGGSSCASCEYLADNKTDCTSEHFQKWNGSPVIPGPIDEYCSDWYEPEKKIAAAEDSDADGTLWNGIKITGFTTPEEEAVRAMLSRIPPELLSEVKTIESAPELGAKHGRYLKETNTIQFNPTNLQLRQRFGLGHGWIQHPELTVVHEVGHSLYNAFTPAKQKEWEDLSGWIKGWKEGQLPPYEEKRPGWEPQKSEWTHKPGIRFTRHYAERNPGEDFADCFGFFILNKGFQMAATKRKFLERLIQDRVQRYPQPVIQSPVKPYVSK